MKGVEQTQIQTIILSHYYDVEYQEVERMTDRAVILNFDEEMLNQSEMDNNTLEQIRAMNQNVGIQ